MPDVKDALTSNDISNLVKSKEELDKLVKEALAANKDSQSVKDLTATVEKKMPAIKKFLDNGKSKVAAVSRTDKDYLAVRKDLTELIVTAKKAMNALKAAQSNPLKVEHVVLVKRMKGIVEKYLGDCRKGSDPQAAKTLLAAIAECGNLNAKIAWCQANVGKVSQSHKDFQSLSSSLKKAMMLGQKLSGSEAVSLAAKKTEKSKAESRLTWVTKFFDEKKGDLADDQVEQVDKQIATAKEQIAASKFAEALKECEEIEKDVKSFLAKGSVPSPDEAKAENRLKTATKFFDDMKSKLTDDERKQIRGQIADVQDDIASSKFADALKECDQIEKDVKAFLAENAGPSPEKVKAENRLKVATKFFDDMKSKLTDDERKQVRGQIADVQDDIAASKFTDALKECDQIEKDVKAFLALNSGPSPEKIKADNRLAAVTKMFDTLKSKLTDDERKQVRGQIADVQDDIEASKFADALKACDQIEKDVKAFLAVNAGPPPEKAKSENRLAAVTKMFDALKSKLTDDERKQVRGQIADVQDKIAGSKFADALKDCGQIEKDVKSFLALNSGPSPEK